MKLIKKMNRLEEIEKEMEKLEESLKKKEDAYDFMQGTFEDYNAMREPEQSQLAALYREQRFLTPCKFEEDVPDYGDVMSMEKFKSCVESGGFIDYDGYGNYVKDGKASDIDIFPSDVKHDMYKKEYDTIVWYNR